MYRIAVCEDEALLRKGLCAQCQEILTRLEVEHTITAFPSAEELEAALSSGTLFDLLCLDILMTGKTGMELALDVRRRNEQISILFITSSTEFLLEGYEARPIRYLLKPVKQKELEKALLTDLRLNHQPRSVTLNARGKTMVLPLADIHFVESQDHNCLFHLGREKRQFAVALAQLETLLPPGQFCRCHNSFLINLAQVREVLKREIILSNDERIPVGRRYADRFQENFIRYLNQDSR